LGVRSALFTGGLKKSAKDELKKRLHSGEIDVAIGTHALIQEGVEYKALNLVIVDEQHRFGVKQRNMLVSKSEYMPHVLTMTATPIPRTLALTVFGDLDISIIAQMPAGRKPIKTKVVSPNSVKTVYNLVLKEVAAGRQAFIIYPLVEESENLKVGDAVSAHEKLSRTFFKDLRVGLIHGRLKSEEKDVVMGRFAKGDLDVLISTTVIEVGVNVPNATVMVVEGAERFGLAQIHQLRGRVGRGEHQAYCGLVPTTSQNVSQRLRALETLTNGFELAEYDLELRGPGAIYGAAQSGALDLRYTKLDNPKMIADAREQVNVFMQSSQELVKYPSLKRRVDDFKTITRLN
jgi:ATP-dependent DNA helicase RecG